MSWATHDVEPYVIKRHVAKLERKLGFQLSFMAILFGSWAPDMMTKWFIYGIKLGPWEIRADDPRQFHRGWPGLGFTHSLAYGVLIGGLVWLIFRKKSAAKAWGIGLMIGIWAHVLSDTLDTNGVMLAFPFTTARVHFDAWQYAGETGRFRDAAAYFSGLGFVWDGFWIAMVLVNYRTLSAAYFRTNVRPDPFFGFLGRWLPEPALLAIFRLGFFYGVCRWISWLLWVHVVHHNAFDPTWGGPDWVKPMLMVFTLTGR